MEYYRKIGELELIALENEDFGSFVSRRVPDLVLQSYIQPLKFGQLPTQSHSVAECELIRRRHIREYRRTVRGGGNSLHIREYRAYIETRLSLVQKILKKES